jgi:hypothetical protein
METKMKTLITRIALTLAMFGALSAAATAQDTGKCSIGKLSGSYGFKMDGANGPAHFAAVGVQTFDGHGNFSTVNTISIDGNVIPGIAFTGTYTVNADCTGSGTANFGPGSTSVVNFVIVDSGKQIYTISADPGSTFTGVFTRL